MLNYGLLKIFGGVLFLSRACNHLCVSVRYTVFLWSVLDLSHLYSDQLSNYVTSASTD